MTHGPSDNPCPPLPERPADGHKGTFGTVVVVGGTSTMFGAPAFAAGAALRVGCGLAKIATTANVLPWALGVEPCATGITLGDGDPMDVLHRATAINDVIALGPGMGTGAFQADLVSALLRQSQHVVLDADGLNNLSSLRDAPTAVHCPLVMTPHPGEFRRLAEAARLRFDTDDPAQREPIAKQVAAAYNAIVVLKGAGTVITDGERCVVNTTGNAALATAGSGDVLTGVIASLIAQGMNPFDAATAGVRLHGIAGDLWAQRTGPVGLTARELLALLPEAYASYSAN